MTVSGVLVGGDPGLVGQVDDGFEVDVGAGEQALSCSTRRAELLDPGHAPPVQGGLVQVDVGDHPGPSTGRRAGAG